jgi:hypothetical protein
MSEYLQSGQHPDPDSLSAFIEGALAEHERLQCLAHLAECPSCREVVYLAQEPLVSEPPRVPAPAEKVSFWKRWFTPIPALRVATAAGTLILSVWLYQHLKSVPNPPEMAAVPETVKQPPAYSLSEPKIRQRVLMPPAPREGKRAPSEKKSAVQQPETASTATPAVPENVSAPAAASAAPPPLPARAVPLMPPQSALLDAASSNALSRTQTGIAGTITDPAGAAVPGAAVKLRPVAGPASRNLTSDPRGQFNVAGLEPGRYELQVMAPGFQEMTKQVDIQPNQMARADSILSVGSVSESVSVTAESERVQTESKDQSALQALPAKPLVQARSALIMTPGITVNQSAAQLLPNKLPANTTVVKGKLMLKTDSTGALFLSQNAGKKWQTVKPVWQGKVVSLIALSAEPAFQLTTDGGAVWLSRDGSHWYAAPAPK